MIRDVVLIAGDGIGPEITAATLEVLEALKAPLRFHPFRAGGAAVAAGEDPLPKTTLAALRKFGLGLKGPLATPVGEGYRSANVAMRQALGLFANVRPVRSIAGVATPFSKVDLVIIRENTEDLYGGLEFPLGKTTRLRNIVARELEARLAGAAAVSLKVTSVSASRRIAEFAFTWALEKKRRRVTAVHKANIMKESDGLFLREVRKIACRYRRIGYDEIIVDNAAQQLVRHPERFDILLCPNLYGDILSDLAAGLVGGIGVVPSAQIGGRVAVFEPMHGTAPSHAGKGTANPMAMMRSAAMLLSYLGDHRRASRLEQAVRAAVAAPSARTRDLGGKATTVQFTRRVLAALR